MAEPPRHSNDASRAKAALPSLIAPRPDLSSLSFDSGLVLLDPKRDQILAYNESAAILWKTIENGGSKAAVGAALCDAYGISEVHGLADATAIIRHWNERGFLENSDGTEAPTAIADSVPAFDLGPERRTTYCIHGNRFRTVIAEKSISHHLEGLLASFIIDETIAELRRSVPAFTVQPEKGTLTFHVNGAERISSDRPLEIVGCILQAMMEIVHDHPNWLAILHSAAIIRDKKSLLLAGRSGSGKTTLSAYLCANGFSHAADDLSPLTAPDGLLAPWPLPHSLKKGSWQALSNAIPELANIPISNMAKGEIKYLAAPLEVWEQKPCPVRAILFPTYYEEGSAPDLTRLRPLDALQRLLEDNVWLGYPLEKSNVQAFLSWLERVPAYALRYGELQQARALIDKHVL